MWPLCAWQVYKQCEYTDKSDIHPSLDIVTNTNLLTITIND